MDSRTHDHTIYAVREYPLPQSVENRAGERDFEKGKKTRRCKDLEGGCLSEGSKLKMFIPLLSRTHNTTARVSSDCWREDAPNGDHISPNT